MLQRLRHAWLVLIGKARAYEHSTLTEWSEIMALVDEFNAYAGKVTAAIANAAGSETAQVTDLTNQLAAAKADVTAKGVEISDTAAAITTATAALPTPPAQV